MSGQVFGAKVKSVLSGDTIILSPLKGGDQERLLALAFVNGPRLSSNEKYGFESREYLRVLLVGKQVQFKVLYSINGRDYGDIVTPIFDSLIEKVVKDGIVKLRDDSSSKDGYEEYEEKLIKAEDIAKSKGNGLWSLDVAEAPTILANISKSIVDSKIEYPSIIERVISGDRIQIRSLIDNNTTHYVGNVLIGGIRAPRSSSPDSPAEPYGDVAKNFVNTRLLQRSVKITFIALSNTGVPIVTVSHPAGDIAEALLKAGLANVVDWQSQYLGSDRMIGLRKAEKVAKESNLNLWKATGGSDESNKSLNTFEAIIAKVISADTFVIRLKSDEERTIQLASIRSPRKTDPAPLDLYTPIAKEFVRSKFIAKKVNVTVISVRPKTDQYDERELVTIELQGKDISSIIVENGYATVIRHRKGDDNDRSPIWDQLVEKETEAINKQLGIHSKKSPPHLRIVDASENLTKAKGFLSSLERQSKIPAIVDYISSGGRLRLLSARENIILTLVLSGIRVPRPTEPSGNEALEFVTKRLWQRDVQFSVNNVDKTGGFIGHVYLPGSSIPLSIALVKEGLAEVHEYSAQQSGLSQSLEDAEIEAKNQKKGLWSNYVEEEVTVAAPTAAPTATPTTSGTSKQYIDILVTSISSTGTISYQTNSSTSQYTKLSAELASYNLSAANSTQFSFKSHLKKGDSVTLNQGNSKFARGKVLVFDKPDKYTVELVDTGDIKKVSLSSLRPLPPQFSFSTTPALSKPAVLSFVQTPPSTYVEDFIAFLEGKAKNKKLVANIDSPPSVTPTSITLFTADSKGADDSLNGAVIYDGYAFVAPIPTWAKDPSWKSTIESLREAESGAKADRVGVWEYGDPRDLED